MRSGRMGAKGIFALLLTFTLAVFITTAPINAQDEITAEPCDPDFSAVRDLLTTAETASAAGDSEGLLTAIQDARSALDSLIKACTVIEFTETLTARGGLLTMNYPKGWVQDITSDNFDSASPTYIQFASSPAVFDTAGSAIPVMSPGGQLIAVVFGTQQALVTGSTVEPSATGILGGVLNSIQQSSDAASFTFSEVETLSINDRRAARVEFGGSTFEAVAYAIEFDNASNFAVVLSLSAPGELDKLDAIALELAKTIKYNPSATGSESSATAEIAPALTATPAQ